MTRLAVLWRRIEHPASVVAVLAGACALWEAAVRLLDIPSFLLPPPSALLSEFADDPSYFLASAAYTAWTTTAGFAAAVALGIALAVGIVYSKLLERTLFTLLIALNSLPKVALAPLFVIWMGTGIAPKIAIALTIAVFSIVINTVFGLRSVDPDLLTLARSARAGEWQILRKIRLPHALPSLFAGMKISISVALVGALVGEFVAGNAGLGQVILVAQANFQIARMFVAVVLLGVMGTIFFYVVELAERIVMPWKS